MNAALFRICRIRTRCARTCRYVLAAVALGCCASAAFAGMETMDLDTRFLAKLAKEKVRIAAQERKEQEEEKGQGQSSSSSGCGSQSIGNVDTGGRIGAAPREVFVFAPNAINLVGNGGCR